MSISTLLMMAYLGAIFTKQRALWGVTAVLAVLMLVMNAIMFITSFSLMALLSGVFSVLIASQAIAQFSGIDVLSKIRNWFRNRR